MGRTLNCCTRYNRNIWNIKENNTKKAIHDETLNTSFQNSKWPHFILMSHRFVLHIMLKAPHIIIQASHIMSKSQHTMKYFLYVL